MPHAAFVHLRVRSAYSLLESTVRFEELAAACRKERMPAVAVADSANLFGAMAFGAEMAKAGVQPILGALLPLCLPEPPGPMRGRALKPPFLPLFVQNERGWANLLKLMSHAHLSPECDEVGVTPERLLDHAEGLILLTGGADGPLGRLLQRGDREGAESLLDALKAAFGDRIYIELQRQGLESQEQTEAAFLDMAFAKGLPLVATNDVLFIDASMHEAHDALVCLAEGTQVQVDDRRRYSLDFRFKTAAEMAESFADLPEAVANTLRIARRCAFAAPARAPILPPFDTGDGRGEAEEMRVQAEAGLEERLVAGVWTEGMDAAARDEAARPYRERLAYELGVIEQMRFPGYFLIVSDFIKWAKGNGIPVGPGRGSGAGSVVAWSLKITDLDPLRFGLLFERFLNPDRVSMPDFDIDFCQDRRDEVIRYVRERYGSEKVAAIITFGRLQARAALRDVGRVLGLPFGLVDRTSKMVPFNPANPPTLAQALQMEPRLEEARRSDPAVRRMIEIALKLEGLPRNASTHAAGVVIGDRPLDELVPLYRDPRSEMPVTQFNMKDVEKAGLVKFDFLGLTTLTMLRFAEERVRERGVPLVLDRLPLEDEATYRLLSRAETGGVFQLESGGMKDALRKLKPDAFEDIIAMVSLYRPGPMDNIPRYINVKHGSESPSYLHGLLEPILAETNGVIIYQEQVMEIAKQLAGYTLGGADLLRRAMGKKIKAEMDAQRETFVGGALQQGIHEGLGNTIFDQVAKFASYGFNKSHAAAYALLAYHTAYLKANHAPEFYAAIMTMEMALLEKLASFRNEMQARGLPLYPPSVNRSLPVFSVEDGEDGLGVRFALAAIKGVGRQAMETLVEERRTNGPFEDIFDMVRRCGTKVLGKRILENLTKAGALDDFSPNRRRMARAIEPAMAYALACNHEGDADQAFLFGAEATQPALPRLEEVADDPTLERLGNEFDVIGFYLSAHPLDGYKPLLARLGAEPIAELREVAARAQGRPVTIAGVLVAKQEKKTERSRFAFLQVSDPSAKVEVMAFAEVLEQSRDLLEVGRLLLFSVDARLDAGEVKLAAIRVEDLAAREGEAQDGVEIVLDDLEGALLLKDVLAGVDGAGAPVRLVLGLGQGREAVLDLPRAFALPYGRRPDVERIAGVVAVRPAKGRGAVAV